MLEWSQQKTNCHKMDSILFSPKNWQWNYWQNTMLFCVCVVSDVKRSIYWRNEARTDTDLWNVTAPCSFLLQCRRDESDGNRRTAARVHRDAEVETIVLSSSSSGGGRTCWRVCGRQQVACWSSRTVTCQTQTAIVRARCKHACRPVTVCSAASVKTVTTPTIAILIKKIKYYHAVWI